MQEIPPFIHQAQVKPIARLTLSPVVHKLPALFTFLESYCKQHQLIQQNLDGIKLVCEEIFINIVSYGQTMDDVLLVIGHDDHTICIQFEDSGVAFNPCGHKTQTNNDCLDDIQIGGLGIIMINKMTSSMQYQRINNSNILCVTFDVKAESV